MEATTLFIYGDIGYDWWDGVDNSAVNFMRKFREAEANYDRIDVRINGYGGGLYDGKAIYNLINQSKKDVHTWLDGSGYSMSGVIWLAAKKENRHTAKNSTLMLHCVLNGGNMNAKQHRKMADDLDVFDNGMVASLAATTGRSEEQVQNEWFDGEDHYFDVNQMVELGLVGHVEDYEAEEVPENKTDLKSVESFYRAMNKADKPKNKAQTIKKTDMDIKTVKAQLGMADDATEEQVLEEMKRLKDADAQNKKEDTPPPATPNTPTETNATQNKQFETMQAKMDAMQAKLDRLSKDPEPEDKGGADGGGDFTKDEKPKASWEKEDDYFNQLAAKAGVARKPQ